VKSPQSIEGTLDPLPQYRLYAGLLPDMIASGAGFLLWRYDAFRKQNSPDYAPGDPAWKSTALLRHFLATGEAEPGDDAGGTRVGFPSPSFPADWVKEADGSYALSSPVRVVTDRSAIDLKTEPRVFYSYVAHRQPGAEDDLDNADLPELTIDAPASSAPSSAPKFAISGVFGRSQIGVIARPALLRVFIAAADASGAFRPTLRDIDYEIRPGDGFDARERILSDPMPAGKRRYKLRFVVYPGDSQATVFDLRVRLE
jgi:hypothetical protein